MKDKRIAQAEIIGIPGQTELVGVNTYATWPFSRMHPKNTNGM